MGRQLRALTSALQVLVLFGWKSTADGNEIAKAHAESEFEKYSIMQDRLFKSGFDRVIKLIASGSQPSIAEE